MWGRKMDDESMIPMWPRLKIFHFSHKKGQNFIHSIKVACSDFYLLPGQKYNNMILKIVRK